MVANILDRRGIAMVVAAILVLSGGVFAQAPQAAPKAADIFVAEAVPVDVTAGSVTEARERGLTQGRVAGFRKVIERMVAREDLPRVPQLNATQIIDIVREFSIANERSSAVRYLADLTVRFDPAAIRNLLRRANVPFTETVSKPLVLVPVFRDAAGTALWSDSNPWRAAWARQSAISLVPLFLPPGDPADGAAPTADQALAKDAQALGALAARYDAGGVMVAVATASEDRVQLQLTEFRRGLPPHDMSFDYSGAAGQSRDETLAGAVSAVMTAVDENWRRRNRVTFGVMAQLTVLVPIEDLKEWLAVKNHLADVPLVDHIDVQAMTRDRAQVTLSYAGEQEQLALAMAQHDLTLAQQNGVWLIELMRDGRPSGRALGRPGAAAASQPTAP